MRLTARPLLAVGLALAMACSAGAKAPAPVDTAADEAAIRAIDTSWNGWLAAQNDSAIAAIYAADAVLMPPNLPRVSNPAAIRGFWAGLWPLKASLVLTPGAIRVSGDMAVEEGNWAFSAPAPTGEQKDNGKYLVVWRKDAGAWHAVQDVWNSDNPPPAAPAKK
jgi:ketosteroid isomerase-like protein